MSYSDEEKSKAYHQHYRDTHKEEARAYQAAYYHRNKDALKAKNRQWRKERAPDYEEQQRLAKFAETIECHICHRRLVVLGRHLGTHGISTQEYKKMFPDAPVITEALSAIRGAASLRRALRNGYDGKEPDSALFSFLTGSLLGDGSLVCDKRNARFVTASCKRGYAQQTHELLRDYFPTTIRKRIAQPHPRTGKRYTAWYVRTSSHPLLTEWHATWYVDKKRVPRDIVEQHLGAAALARWFFDDGCNSKGDIFLYPLCFAVDDVLWLSELLQARFGLVSSVLLNKHGQAHLHILRESRERFLELVGSYATPDMEYKITGRREVIHDGAH